MLLRFVSVAICVGLAYSALYLQKNPPKPPGFEDKEGCYISDINDVIPFEKSYSPIDACYRIYCTKDTIQHASCIFQQQPDDRNCSFTDPDLTKPYPECCSTLQCD